MNRTTQVALILCVSISCSVVSGQGKPATFAAPRTNEPTVIRQPAPSVYDPAKVVVSVINSEAKRSELVLAIIDALEKSGIERSDAPADQNWNDDRITARIRIQSSTTPEKITALIKAMQYAGVQKFSLTNPTVDGNNMLFLVANTPQPRNDIERIQQAAKHAAEENDLVVDVISTIPAATDDIVTNGNAHKSTARATTPFSGPAVFAQPSPLTNPHNNSPQLPIPPSDPESSKIAPDVLSNQIKDLSREYTNSNNQALELAESLRQTPDPKQEAELRSLVARALRARQDLLQAELQQMQYRFFLPNVMDYCSRRRSRFGGVERRRYHSSHRCLLYSKSWSVSVTKAL